jgi:hypothetical protein
VHSGDEAQQRIAELESELAAQKRINELQSQLSQARVAAAPVLVSQRRVSSRGGVGLRGASVVGGIVGFLGFCAGAAAALIAVFPSSALWTSAIVCGGPGQLMTNTSHYSYKPGQSGTTVEFECLRADGAYDANWLAISALQGVMVTLVLAAVLAVVVVVRRKARQEPVTSTMTMIAGGLAIVAAAVVAFALSQSIGSSSSTQIPHGGTLAIKGNGDSKTIACNDGHLSVDGRDMTVTVTGHCSRLSVDGVISHVTVDSADAIDVDGVNNVVTYHSGSPQITKSGGQNTVAGP